MNKKPRVFIREWREYLGKPFEGVVAAAGKEQSSVYRYESGSVNPPPDVLGRVADYLGISIGDLYALPPGFNDQKKRKPAASMADPGRGAADLAPPPLDLGFALPSNNEVRPASVPLPDRQSMPRNLPVLGTAQGGTEGAFQIEGIVDYVRRPPGLERAARAYAFYVENVSMVPQHNPGELRFVHPDRKAGIGDTVVIQIRNGPEEPIQSFIKILKKRDQRRLIVEQLNPPKVLEFPIDRVVSVHKVLTLNDLFEA